MRYHYYRRSGSYQTIADQMKSWPTDSLYTVPAIGVVSLLIGWDSMAVICGIYWLVYWTLMARCVGGVKFVKIACYLLGRLVIIFVVGLVLFCQYAYYFTGAL